MPLRYRSLPDLADRLEATARAGREARITPQTTLVIVAALRAFASEPSREAIVAALCHVGGGCVAPCMTCVGRANLVMRLYRGDEGPEIPDPGAGAPRRTASLKIV